MRFPIHRTCELSNTWKLSPRSATCVRGFYYTVSLVPVLTIDWFPHNARSIPNSNRRRIPPPDRKRHAHAHPGQNNPPNPFPNIRIQHHQCLHPDRSDFETRNRTPFTNTSPCTRTEGATHHTPCTRTEGARTRTDYSSPSPTATIPSTSKERQSSEQTASPLPNIPSRPTKHVLPAPSYLYQPTSFSPMRHQQTIGPSHCRARHRSTHGRQTRLTYQAPSRS